jgi:hypothetical protein
LTLKLVKKLDLLLRSLKILGACLAGFAVSATTVWAAGAIYYSPIPGPALRLCLAGIVVVATALTFLLTRRRGRMLLVYLLVFAAFVGLWLQIPASNERAWQPEVALTPYATMTGHLITIHNLRNFEYRSETDFDVRWEKRTYDFSKLDSLDVIAVYWAGKPIAHIMLSFGFEGKDYLAVSIETRKESGESYSTLAGFFRQYELYYVVADERDVVRVRTTYRRPQEDVYIYRVRGPRENLRRIFLDYVRSINELHERPGFYNTLTTNCTTSILFHTRVNADSPPLSWKVLLSGYVPDYLYELDRLDTALPFAELEKISRVNERAHAADRDPTFSQRIREGLPLIAPLPQKAATGESDQQATHHGRVPSKMQSGVRKQKTNLENEVASFYSWRDR